MAHVSFEGVCCADCVQPVANGDFSSLYYYYGDDEGDTKAFQIECGMEELCEEHGGSLHIGDLVDEFSRERCDVCGTTLAGSRHGIVVLASYDDSAALWRLDDTQDMPVHRAIELFGRSTLDRLANQGLVDVGPGRSTRVVNLSEEGRQKIYA